MNVRLALLLAIAAPVALGAQAPAKNGTAKPAAPAATAKPAAGKEGTKVTITYPKALPEYPKELEARIFDPGVHGYVIKHGAGIYVAYDGHRGSSYTVPATAVGDDPKKNAYEFTIPPGVCGIIIQSTQATVSKVPAGDIQGSPTVIGQNVTKYPRKSAGGKALQLSLVGAKGKPAHFSLTCEKYTLSVKVSAEPQLVQPLPGTSTVTATLTVKGPAQVVVGAKLEKPANPPMLLAPLAFETVMFDTNFGQLAPPAPAKVVTDMNGTATVAVSSGAPGTANPRAVAGGIGDGRTTVQFAQKIADDDAKPARLGPPPADPGEPGKKTPQQCAAETQQRHRDILGGMKGKPTHEIAQALADSDAKSPSMAECTGRRGGGGSGDDTTPIMSSGPTGDPQLDGAVEDANKSATEKTPQVPTNSNHTKEIALGAAGAGIATIAVTRGGGGGGTSTPPTSTGTGTTPAPTPWDPRTLNSPPPYKGDQILQSTAVLSTQNQCAGSDGKFGESVTVNLNASGAGTITLDDTPGFQRVYPVTVTALNQAVTSQGTFSFLGTSVPGTLSITFNSTTQLTMRETTTFGSCSNTYSGSMSR